MNSIDLQSTQLEMPVSNKIGLTQRDYSVLGAIFDPEASLQGPAVLCTTTKEPYNSTTMDQIREKEKTAILLMNEDRPELDKVKEALTQFDDLVTTFPLYASAWNNRAQAMRILCNISENDDSLNQTSQMYNDLSRAIELCQPEGAIASVSASSKEVLASAHTQRGLLLMQSSHSESTNGWSATMISSKTSSRDDLEELASKDFYLGGKYGNRVAQQLAVKTNPYAKLCGSIVREAIAKEIEEFRQQNV